jgi:hypothetical protein
MFNVMENIYETPSTTFDKLTNVKMWIVFILLKKTSSLKMASWTSFCVE